MLHGGHVVGDLDDVVERHTRSFFHLEQQQVGQRRLGAFDLRREDGLAANVGIEKQVRIGQQRRDAVQPAAGQQGAIQQPLSGRCQRQRLLLLP